MNILAENKIYELTFVLTDHRMPCTFIQWDFSIVSAQQAASKQLSV